MKAIVNGCGWLLLQLIFVEYSSICYNTCQRNLENKPIFAKEIGNASTLYRDKK